MGKFNPNKGLRAGLKAKMQRRAEEAAIEAERLRRASLSQHERDQEDLMDEMRWQIEQLKEDQERLDRKIRGLKYRRGDK